MKPVSKKQRDNHFSWIEIYHNVSPYITQNKISYINKQPKSTSQAEIRNDKATEFRLNEFSKIVI